MILLRRLDDSECWLGDAWDQLRHPPTEWELAEEGVVNPRQVPGLERVSGAWRFPDKEATRRTLREAELHGMSRLEFLEEVERIVDAKLAALGLGQH